MAKATGTLTVRVPGFPEPIEFADWTHDSLYHTVQMTDGSAIEIQAFIGAQGATIPGGARMLTPVDTNIPRSGDSGLSEGWECLVYSVRIQPTREFCLQNGATAQLADGGNQLSRPIHTGGGDPAYLSGGILFDFMRKTYVKMLVNQKVQNEGCVSKYPAGEGIYVFGTSTDLEVAGNGKPSPQDARVLTIPIWLRANIGFVCKLAPQVALGPYVNWSGLVLGALADGFDVRVSLDGLLKRPVT